jgi:ATP-dependent DNA ligase
MERNRPAASVKTTKRLENQKGQNSRSLNPCSKAVTALPSDEQWTFEIKFDGYRSLL